MFSTKKPISWDSMNNYRLCRLLKESWKATTPLYLPTDKQAPEKLTPFKEEISQKQRGSCPKPSEICSKLLKIDQLQIGVSKYSSLSFKSITNRYTISSIPATEDLWKCVGTNFSSSQSKICSKVNADQLKKRWNGGKKGKKTKSWDLTKWTALPVGLTASSLSEFKAIL